MSDDHQLQLEGPIQYPGGKNGMFKSHCTCGYESGFGTERSAEKDWQQHAEAKTAAVRDPGSSYYTYFR